MNQKFHGKRTNNRGSLCSWIWKALAILSLAQCISKKPPFKSVTIMVPQEVREKNFELPISDLVVNLIKNKQLPEDDLRYFDALVDFKMALISKSAGASCNYATKGRIRLEKAIHLGSVHALLLKGFLVKHGNLGYPKDPETAHKIWDEYLKKAQQKVKPSKLVPWRIIGSVEDLK